MRTRIAEYLGRHPSVRAYLILALIGVFVGWAQSWIVRSTEDSTAQERLWTLVAVIALGFTCWTVDDNIKNYWALRRAIRRGRAVMYGPRWWFAVSSIVSSVVMYVVWLGFATIGVVAMQVGPHDPASERLTVTYFNGYVLVVLTIALAIVQVWQVWVRNQIRKIPTFREDGHGTQSATT